MHTKNTDLRRDGEWFFKEFSAHVAWSSGCTGCDLKMVSASRVGGSFLRCRALCHGRATSLNLCFPRQFLKKWNAQNGISLRAEMPIIRAEISGARFANTGLSRSKGIAPPPKRSPKMA
jgi:hypothetical protein